MIALASGAQRSICGAVARSGLESEQRPSPKGASNFGQSLSHGEAVTAPVVPKAWPPPTKRRWRLGRRSRCPKFFARMRSQNFDRCHSFLLASSVTGGARKRPSFHKGALGTGDADCHVGPVGLLAMTTVSCHSEERSDVGIRPFYDGRGFGPPYLGHGLRRPNSVPKFGASVKSSAPAESPINDPNQPARSEAPAPAAVRDGRESAQRPSQKGDCPATAGAALSEAESAGIVAGQIQSLPDNLRVQHGVQRSEV